MGASSSCARAIQRDWESQPPLYKLFLENLEKRDFEALGSVLRLFTPCSGEVGLQTLWMPIRWISSGV
jgi:hypothetical protein